MGVPKRLTEMQMRFAEFIVFGDKDGPMTQGEAAIAAGYAMDKAMFEIYPKELILVPDESIGQSVSFLDLKLTIKDSVIYTHIYDKRDLFDFPVINFPVLSGNIPLNGSYGSFIGELVRYARACTYVDDFKTRTLSFVTKLLKQFYTKKRLTRTWRKFCDSHIFLILKYGSQILDLYKEWM